MPPEQQYVENNLAGFLQTNTDWSETEARELLADIYRDTNDTDPVNLDEEAEDDRSNGWDGKDDRDCLGCVYAEDCDCCDTDEDASQWGY
jgi:hypothetical protein